MSSTFKQCTVKIIADMINNVVWIDNMKERDITKWTSTQRHVARYHTYILCHERTHSCCHWDVRLFNLTKINCIYLSCKLRANIACGQQIVAAINISGVSLYGEFMLTRPSKRVSRIHTDRFESILLSHIRISWRRCDFKQARKKSILISYISACQETVQVCNNVKSLLS